MSDVELDGELISEEDVETGSSDQVRALPREYESASEMLPGLRNEMTTAAIALVSDINGECSSGDTFLIS